MGRDCIRNLPLRGAAGGRKARALTRLGDVPHGNVCLPAPRVGQERKDHGSRPPFVEGLLGWAGGPGGVPCCSCSGFSLFLPDPACFSWFPPCMEGRSMTTIAGRAR